MFLPSVLRRVSCFVCPTFHITYYVPDFLNPYEMKFYFDENKTAVRRPTI